MKKSEPDLIVQGLIGGGIAGGVVVIWFFAADMFAGLALETPARLAAAVLGEEFSGVWPRHIAVFTLMHFGIFMALGVVCAWALAALRLPPGLILGAVFGIGVLNAVHYTGLLVTGTNLLTVIPVAHVVAANLLGGMVMMAYFHRVWRTDTPLGWQILKRYPVLYEGLGTGLVGAGTVALWFFLLDLATRTPFYTPAAIGSALMLGAQDASAVQFNLGIILGYSFLHLATFLAVGVAFAWLASRQGERPGVWMRSLAVLVLLEGLFLGSVGIATGWVMEALGWPFILIANVLAVGSMGAWIWRRSLSAATGVPARAS
jgi:hypothetical protein